MSVVDKKTGAKAVLDHKTTGKISEWWLKKFRLVSQLSGYVYALGNKYGENVHGAYVNAIEFNKLPVSKNKCRKHGVKYTECRERHCNFQLFNAHRPQHLLDMWLNNAKILAKKYWMLTAYTEVEMIPFIAQEGKFNNGCTFCQYGLFCFSGRPIDMVDGMFVKMPWMPWDKSVHMKKI
jgi:hypothetical protein